MNRNLFHWADPATVGVYVEMRNLAPELSSLMYCAAMPERSLATVLDWSETVTDLDPGPAFSVERLREVLPALVVAFVASHTYELQERREGDGDVINLYDAGCGTLVGEVMGLTGLLAIALHGEPGRALVESARRDLAGNLLKISERVAGR